MSSGQILVVADEEALLELLRQSLGREGYRLVCVTSGEQALAKASEETLDLILLDLMLPDMYGLEVCRQLKTNPTTRNVPIIMLSEKSEDADIVASLEAGADDYVAKPFSPRVLLARVRSLLRRKMVVPPHEDQVIRIHGIKIEPAYHQVTVQGKRIVLTPSELKILLLLARNPGRVYSRDEIITTVRGDDHSVADRSVDVAISQLREKLGEFRWVIETRRGVGYRFKDESMKKRERESLTQHEARTT
jgi:two-component system phosphate regulon response regulator PhoB